MEATIKPCEKKDVKLLLGLMRELAVYEKLEDTFAVTEEILSHSLFEEKSAEAALAYADGKPAGYVIYFSNFSSFIGKPGMYLEDIYVKPEYRKQGIGLKLFKYVGKTAVERGCLRYEWVCLNWNTPSANFYKSLGAEPLTEWTTFRLSGDALKKMAD